MWDITKSYGGKQERIDWNEFFMRSAIQISNQSTCKSGRKVGAVFVKNKVQIMSSFNGVPPKFPHPEKCERRERGCASGENLELCPCNHAESNGISQAARNGISLLDSILYCTTKPCVSCMGMIAVAGIKKVIFLEEYDHEVSELIAGFSGIELEKFSPKGDR